MKPLVRVSIVIVLGSLLAGCFSPVKTPPQSKYFFNPNVATIQSEQTVDTILINKPVAAAGYTTHRMAYIEKPSELAYYTRNRWVAPPADMLQPLLVDSIQRSKHFRAVAEAPFAGKTRYRLDTDLIYIRQNLTIMPHRLEIAMHVRLVDNTDQQIIASGLFESFQDVLKLEPYDSVLTANAVLAQMLSDVTRFVVANTER